MREQFESAIWQLRTRSRWWSVPGEFGQAEGLWTNPVFLGRP
ncbi:hypothetical protein [Streptomyces gilvus]|nr:hypothetical protein [Streptomyces sp. CME 23]